MQTNTIMVLFGLWTYRLMFTLKSNRSRSMRCVDWRYSTSLRNVWLVIDRINKRFFICIDQYCMLEAWNHSWQGRQCLFKILDEKKMGGTKIKLLTKYNIKKCINHFFFLRNIVQQRYQQVKLQQESASLLPPLSPLSFNRPPKACREFGRA